MSSETHRPPEAETGMDREISLKAVLWTGVGLALTIVVSMVLMWWLSQGLKERNVEADPTPPPISEALERRLPPGPRLQGAPGSAFERRSFAPELELRELRAEERRLLESYGWADRGRGLARIPVERALELVAERGLPSFAPLGGQAATPTVETDGNGTETDGGAAAGEETP